MGKKVSHYKVEGKEEERNGGDGSGGGVSHNAQHSKSLNHVEQ